MQVMHFARAIIFPFIRKGYLRFRLLYHINIKQQTPVVFDQGLLYIHRNYLL